MNNEEIAAMSDDYSTCELYVDYNSYLANKYEESLKEMIKNDPSRFQNNNDPFIILEFGCNDIIVSIPIHKKLVNCIREINLKLPIAIYFNDLPNVDWRNAILYARKCLDQYENLYLNIVPQSFFKPLMLQRTVDFCFGTFCLYYLTRIPEKGVGCGLQVNLLDKGKPNAEEWFKIMDEDWELFAKLRENELKMKGRLHIALTSFHDIPTEDNKRYHEFANILMKKCIIDSCKKHGISNGEELILMPWCMRMKEQYMSYLNSGKTSLKALSWDYIDFPISFYEEYIKDNDRHKYALRSVDHVRVWSYNDFKKGLVKGGIDEKLAVSILDEGYGELVKYVEKRDDLIFGKQTLITIIIEKSD